MAFTLAIQLLIISFCSLTFGLFLHRTLFRDAKPSTATFLITFFSGFAAQLIVLQNLVYANLKIQWTFWLCPCAALLAWVILKRTAFKAISAIANRRQDGLIVISLLLCIYVAQTVTALCLGPDNYYGFARIDHLNYTVTSEHLLHEKFTPDADGPNPQDNVWMLKTAGAREQRIGQSVLQAYLAAVSLSSTKNSYAGAVAFCIGLMGLATFALARSVSLSRPYAIFAAMWASLCPGITKMSLEGFMSQACTLFVFPWVALVSRARLPLVQHIIVAAIPLSFLFITYTEMFPIGVAILGLATVSVEGITVRATLKIVGSSLLAVVFVPAYLPKAIDFLRQQFVTASGRSGLDALAPDGGTAFGWISTLLSMPFVSHANEYRILTLVAACLAVVCALGIFANPPRKSLYLGSITAAVGIVLSALASNPEYSRYTFQKIQTSFSFLWIVLAVYGIAKIQNWLWSVRPARLVRVGFLCTLAAISVLAAMGYARFHAQVFRQEGVLQILGHQSYREAIAYAQHHPHSTYLIKESDGVVGGWLAYHTFRAKTYYDAPAFSDIPLSPGMFRFSLPAKDDPQMVMISRNGVRDQATRNPQPDLWITNPQGFDQAGTSGWYWLGDVLTVEIGRWDGSSALREATLSFDGEPGPAHPSNRRVLSLLSERDSTMQSITINGITSVKVPIKLSPGLNKFLLQSLEPTEHIVKISADPRKHLTRLANFQVTIQGTASQATLKSSVPPLGPPEVIVENPQGRDSSRNDFWYWVGKDAQLRIKLNPASGASSIRLKMRVEPGPANPTPTRRIRLANRSLGFERSFSFGVPTILDTIAPVSGDETTYSVEVLEPVAQTVRIPNDARNHMVRLSNVSATLVPTPAGNSTSKK